jgi:hypothetical protein
VVVGSVCGGLFLVWGCLVMVALCVPVVHCVPVGVIDAVDVVNVAGYL